MFHEKFYRNVFWALECPFFSKIIILLENPKNSGIKKIEYLKFLTEKAKFKNCLNLSANIALKIKLNYRLLYLKDYVIGSYADE